MSLGAKRRLRWLFQGHGRTKRRLVALLLAGVLGLLGAEAPVFAGAPPSRSISGR